MDKHSKICKFDYEIYISESCDHNALSIMCYNNLSELVDITMERFYNELCMQCIGYKIIIKMVVYFLHNKKSSHIQTMINKGDIAILDQIYIIQLFVFACKYNNQNIALKLLELINSNGNSNESINEKECYLDQQVILDVCNCGVNMDKVVCELLKKYPWHNRIQNIPISDDSLILNECNSDKATNNNTTNNLSYFQMIIYNITQRFPLLCMINNKLTKASFYYALELLDMYVNPVNYYNYLVKGDQLININRINLDNCYKSSVFTYENFMEKKELDTLSSHSDDNNLECIICSTETECLYVSIKCGHITRLCNRCHKEYAKCNSCSVCRKPLSLIKCFMT